MQIIQRKRKYEHIDYKTCQKDGTQNLERTQGPGPYKDPGPLRTQNLMRTQDPMMIQEPICLFISFFCCCCFSHKQNIKIIYKKLQDKNDKRYNNHIKSYNRSLEKSLRCELLFSSERTYRIPLGVIMKPLKLKCCSRIYC